MITLLVVTVVLIIQVQYSSCNLPNKQLCVSENMRVLNADSQGVIDVKWDSKYLDEQTPCVLKMETCSHCYISIKPQAGMNFGNCQNFNRVSTRTCTKDSRFLFMFDGYYMNETLQCYNKNGDSWFSSKSSLLYIGLCHNFGSIGDRVPIDFYLNYTIMLKEEFHSKSSGMITSVFFPNMYFMNAEQYTFTITGDGTSGFYELIFTDWDISYTSEVFIDTGENNKIYHGRSSRPSLGTTKNEIKIIFETGWEYQQGLMRIHMGFKAAYKFTPSPHAFKTIPDTDCGAYLLHSDGGVIDLTKHINLSKNRLFDCVWVVKTQPGYQKTMINLIEDTIQSYSNTKSVLKIHAGLTSDGQVLDTITSARTVKQWQQTNPDGFYLHLHGRFDPDEIMKFSYTSVIVDYSCPAKTWLCGRPKYCIPSRLKCDGIDHCGDKSDETRGCSGYGDSFRSNSQQTIAVSVIIPVIISVVLIFMLLVLFLLIRRYRQAHLLATAHHNNELPSVHGEMSERERRRERRRRRRADLPPTYEDALMSPPMYPHAELDLNGPLDDLLPKPPPYSEAIATPQQQPDSMITTPQTSAGDSVPPFERIAVVRNLASEFPPAPPSPINRTRPTLHSYSNSYSSEESFESPQTPITIRFSENDRYQHNSCRREGTEGLEDHPSRETVGTLPEYSQELPICSILSSALQQECEPQHDQSHREDQQTGNRQNNHERSQTEGSQTKHRQNESEQSTTKVRNRRDVHEQPPTRGSKTRNRQDVHEQPPTEGSKARNKQNVCEQVSNRSRNPQPSERRNNCRSLDDGRYSRSHTDSSYDNDRARQYHNRHARDHKRQTSHGDPSPTSLHHNSTSALNTNNSTHPSNQPKVNKRFKSMPSISDEFSERTSRLSTCEANSTKLQHHVRGKSLENMGRTVSLPNSQLKPCISSSEIHNVSGKIKDQCEPKRADKAYSDQRKNFKRPHSSTEALIKSDDMNHGFHGYLNKAFSDSSSRDNIVSAQDLKNRLLHDGVKRSDRSDKDRDRSGVPDKNCNRSDVKQPEMACKQSIRSDDAHSKTQFVKLTDKVYRDSEPYTFEC